MHDQSFPMKRTHRRSTLVEFSSACFLILVLVAQDGWAGVKPWWTQFEPWSNEAVRVGGTVVGMDFQRLVVGREIGRGSSGLVHGAFDTFGYHGGTFFRSATAPYAVKFGILKGLHPGEWSTYRNYPKLDDLPGIVPAVGLRHFENYHIPVWVMENAGTSLASSVSQSRTSYPTTLSPELATAATIQMVEALQGLHGLGLAHGQLRLSNILWRDSDPATVKLGDMSHVVPFETVMSGNRWDLPFVAPEHHAAMLSKGFFGGLRPQSEVWASGQALAELITGNRLPVSDGRTSIGPLWDLSERGRIPKGITSAVSKATHVDWWSRPSLADFANDLRAIQFRK